MMFSKLFGARVVEIRTETCRALCRAIVLSAVALCVFGTLQVAEARGLRPLIYKPDDAARTATAARLRDAEQKHQALKFDAPDFMNIEAKVLGAGHKSTVAAQKTGTVAARNPVDVIAAMVAAIVAPKAVAQEAPGGPQVTGAWQTLPYLMPINPIHMCMLHNGNIGCFSCPATMCSTQQEAGEEVLPSTVQHRMMRRSSTRLPKPGKIPSRPITNTIAPPGAPFCCRFFRGLTMSRA